MARIVTVYGPERRVARGDMAYIRWFKIAEALARCGHEVDIATGEFKWRLRQPPVQVSERLRRVPLARVRWRDYDVVKTLFHRGFETLERCGGAGHPFIISKLGSVVGPEELPGIYFYGQQRQALYAVQHRIDGASRYVTVLSEPARDLWVQCFDRRDRVLIIPGAVDREIPLPGPDPYPRTGEPRCAFAGNFYSVDRRVSQPEAHHALVAKLNRLGALLAARGACLYVVGPGDARRLDPHCVRYLGMVPYERSWDYLFHAQVGVVVSAGPFMHNNESSKLYHYLRAGLPVVTEAGFPNDYLVREAKLGFVVESGNLDLLAERIMEAMEVAWDREAAIAYILRHHTWDRRVEVYDRLIRADLTG